MGPNKNQIVEVTHHLTNLNIPSLEPNIRAPLLSPFGKRDPAIEAVKSDFLKNQTLPEFFKFRCIRMRFI
jgi:hypothetical protein